MSHWPGNLQMGAQERGDAGAQHKDAALEQCPPFDPQQMRKQLGRDGWLRTGVIVFLLLLFFGSLVNLIAAVFPPILVMRPAWERVLPWLFPLSLVILGVWIYVSVTSVKVAQQLSTMSGLVDRDPARAEDALAKLMRRRMLQRSVRLLLYHRLAVLRHRQGRFDESSAIGLAVLGEDARAIRALESHLWLMIGDGRLQCGDTGGAYASISRLHGMTLRLPERLQLLTLQTRYEIATGHDGSALSDLARKIRFAELMPAGQCGAVHALLAIAATRQDKPVLADWLSRRAALLCSPEQLDALDEATRIVLDQM